MVENKNFAFSPAVRIRENVLVDRAVRLVEIVKVEVIDMCEKMAQMQKREDLTLVSLHKRLIDTLVFIGAAVFHAVFFGKSLDLAVSEHRKSRHRYHKKRDSEVFVVVSELRDCRLLIGIVEEVDVSFENVRIEFENAFD